MCICNVYTTQFSVLPYEHKLYQNETDSVREKEFAHTYACIAISMKFLPYKRETAPSNVTGSPNSCVILKEEKKRHTVCHGHC